MMRGIGCSGDCGSCSRRAGVGENAVAQLTRGRWTQMTAQERAAFLSTVRDGCRGDFTGMSGLGTDGASIATGAASGAATGATLGPVGAIVGGVVGAAGGYLTSRKAGDSDLPKELALISLRQTQIQRNAARASSKDETTRTWMWIGGGLAAVLGIGAFAYLFTKRRKR